MTTPKKVPYLFFIELGSKVKSVITGFSGTVISRAHNAFGPDTYFVKPTVGTDGKDRDGLWISHYELEPNPGKPYSKAKKKKK